MNLEDAFTWYEIWLQDMMPTAEMQCKIEQNIFDCLELGINEGTKK